jgi:hypothetical protein
MYKLYIEVIKIVNSIKSKNHEKKNIVKRLNYNAKEFMLRYVRVKLA